eukprot:GHVH01014029.1.p1 GENE.GHVH01014029.1~~GHVH01014029.1.p1  ORF type:complete len:177 (+),score=26.55 GHVH01014029.1:35-565(+)
MQDDIQELTAYIHAAAQNDNPLSQDVEINHRIIRLKNLTMDDREARSELRQLEKFWKLTIDQNRRATIITKPSSRSKEGEDPGVYVNRALIKLENAELMGAQTSAQIDEQGAVLTGSAATSRGVLSSLFYVKSSLSRLRESQMPFIVKVTAAAGCGLIALVTMIKLAQQIFPENYT